MQSHLDAVRQNDNRPRAKLDHRLCLKMNLIAKGPQARESTDSDLVCVTQAWVCHTVISNREQH